MNKPIATGNIRRFFTACTCGRGFETDEPLYDVPAHVHNHMLITDRRLCSEVATHTCTGCSWTVDTHTPISHPDTQAALNRAFAKHLLTTAAEEAAAS